MQTMFRSRLISLRSTLQGAFAVAALLLATGCVTDDVRTTIKESNAALMASVVQSNTALMTAQLPDIESTLDPASVRAPDVAALSHKIDDFAAAHPNDKGIISPLRIRQAMLLLTAGEYEMARSAFAEATELHAPRDKALKELSEPIIWWWQHSTDNLLDSETKRKAAKDNLGKFDAQITTLPKNEAIRDYLAEMRVRISILYVKSLSEDPTAVRTGFLAMVNQYGATFTPADVTAIKDKKLKPAGTAISAADKRRLRALPLIPEIKKAAARVKESGGLSLADFDANESVQAFAALILSE